MKQIIYTALAVFFLSACSSENQENKETDSKANTVDPNVASEESTDAFAALESEADEFILPSPLKIAQSFNDANMSYHAGLTLPVENSKQVTGKLPVQLIFGVYTADLFYLVNQQQNDEARGYMGAVQTMASKAGISAVFENKDLIEKFNDSLEYPEVVTSVLYELHWRTELYLEENGLQAVQAINYAGAWIEAMYLGSHDAKAGDNKVSQNVSMNMEFLHNIIKGLKRVEGEWEGLDLVIADLQAVSDKYNGFPSVVSSMESGEETALTEEEVKELTGMIAELRNKIVQQ